MQFLLVEDDVVLGDALKSHIELSNHRIDWCQSAACALVALEIEKYELVLLDLRLPDGQGLALLRQLRSRKNLTPVIIITAYDQYTDLTEGLAAGANDFIVKPFNLADLDARIVAILTRQENSQKTV